MKHGLGFYARILAVFEFVLDCSEDGDQDGSEIAEWFNIDDLCHNVTSDVGCFC